MRISHYSHQKKLQLITLHHIAHTNMSYQY
jgi:hypothetical protein